VQLPLHASTAAGSLIYSIMCPQKHRQDLGGCNAGGSCLGAELHACVTASSLARLHHFCCHPPARLLTVAPLAVVSRCMAMKLQVALPGC
jgi:hypothetical protein